MPNTNFIPGKLFTGAIHDEWAHPFQGFFDYVEKPPLPEVEPQKPKTMMQWVVVCTEGGANAEEVMSTRAEARAIIKYDKKNGFKTHIERREYQLISSKKVS